MINKICDDIWEAHHDLWMSGMVHFKCRMTIIRLPNGDLWLHSPVKYSQKLANQLEQLGPIAYLIAPNCLHHLFIKDWSDAYPHAKTYAAPGLEEKRKDITFKETLTDKVPAEWGASFQLQQIHGMPKVNEFVFLHKPSGTLILTDLIFNIKNAKGILTQIMLWCAGARGKLAQSRLLKYFFTKDRVAAGRSIEPILDWNFERIIMAHGEIISDEGTKLRNTLSWMLGKTNAA